MRTIRQLARLSIPPVTVPISFMGQRVFVCLRDNIFYVLSKRESLEADPFFDIPKGNGIVWDLGCNIGLWSVNAAIKGWRVLAFDISAKAIKLLFLTAISNDLNIKGNVSAVSASRQFRFNPKKTSLTENKAAYDQSGQVNSVHFETVAQLFGMPQIIKMDIEGAEADFLADPLFEQWIRENKITLQVEIHNGMDSLAWGGMKRLKDSMYALSH